MADLEGKVAIVTGGASGLGRATVECFAAEGARVVIADMNAERGETLARENSAGAVLCKADVSRAEEMNARVAFAVSHFGGLEITCNNAGVSGKLTPRFLDQYVVEQRSARELRPCLLPRCQSGRQFTKSVAIDLAEHNIRVNCLLPGNIQTEMNAVMPPASVLDPDAWRQKLGVVRKSAQPLKRSGAPNDVAQAALFLASGRSAPITGVSLPVDGDITIGDPINRLQAIIDAQRAAQE